MEKQINIEKAESHFAAQLVAKHGAKAVAEMMGISVGHAHNIAKAGATINSTYEKFAKALWLQNRHQRTLVISASEESITPLLTVLDAMGIEYKEI